jgi:hypothetical protein
MGLAYTCRSAKVAPRFGYLEVTFKVVRADIGPWLAATSRPMGFRSSFRDWASELTNFAPEVAAMALARALDESRLPTDAATCSKSAALDGCLEQSVRVAHESKVL